MAVTREMTFDDYLTMLRRHVWLIVVPALLVPLSVYLISLKIPNRYTSQTLVLVEQQKVPDAFVKPVVTEDLNARLATMQEQILSRTQLQPIIDRFGLYKTENIPLEDKIEKVRKSIQVAPVKTLIATKTGGLPGFYISFTGDNARTAQQVCGEITSMFMTANLRAREQSAQGTTDFLAKQLVEAKRTLDEQDGKLARFKERYFGQLPGQEQTNTNVLTSLNSQLDASTQALYRLQQDKTYTETLLNQQIAAHQRAENSDTPESLQQQLELLQATLIKLQARYTPDHPDVVRTTADIAAIKARLEQAPAAEQLPPKPSTAEPLGIQQLRAQVRGLETAIVTKKQDQERLQRQIGIYQARLQLSPRVEEEYKAMSRDYQTALQFYNDLLAKKTQSEMATDLERRQQGEQFRVMDPPNLPEKPTFPNRPLFALGGFAGGLILGLGLSFLLELRDKSLHNERDVRLYLDLPTLALLPVVGADERNSKPRRLARVMSRPRERLEAR